jgi:hypothetical protein
MGFASPSVFPENAAFFSVGYSDTLLLDAGVELYLPVDIIDASVGLEIVAAANDLNNSYNFRASGNALVIPALGTSPPLALGFAADVGFGTRGFSVHGGPLIGTDLLFSADLPMTLSGYVGLGYRDEVGFDISWAGQLRYYFEDFDTLAIELATSDLMLLSVGVRFFF